VTVSKAGEGSPITTHVLDTARGVPAPGIPVRLERKQEEKWVRVAIGVTDAEGRVTKLLPAGYPLLAGTYRLTFFTEDFFIATPSFYGEIPIEFHVTDEAAHYHVPLLLSPFGYSTFRGS
jgi:5-hydroxyisourate hydrolase